jgi:hypothetical protein
MKKCLNCQAFKLTYSRWGYCFHPEISAHVDSEGGLGSL